MTRRRHDGTTDRSINDLIAIAIADLEAIRDQTRWLRSLSDGKTRADVTSRSSNIDSDPTMSAALAARQASTKLRRAHERLAGLVDKTLPSITAGLELDSDDPRNSERPLMSDDNDTPDRAHLGPADITGGISAYRGEHRAPRARTDLQEALDAQHRRLERGEGYGDG